MIHDAAQFRQTLSLRLLSGRGFAVKTGPAVRYLVCLVDWLTMGSQGGVVYGGHRIGKTSATRWVLKQLPMLVGPVPSLEVPLRHEDRKQDETQSAFFQYLLRCAKHRHAAEGGTQDKRDRFTEWVYARAVKSPIRTFVLVIDEAQLLGKGSYLWLLNIANELDVNACRLFCLLVGQPDLAERKIEFLDAQRENIVGRFLINELPFSGLCSEQELQECLAEFDTTEYPPGSGAMFPTCFAPNWYASGERLSGFSRQIWQILRNISADAGLDDVIVPMQYVTSFVTRLLSHLGSQEGRQMREVPGEVLRQLIVSTGVHASIRLRALSSTDGVRTKSRRRKAAV